jgi:hypothetical protein
MTMSEQRIQSFEEFWPFYVREHRLRSTRRLHVLGTTLGLAVFIAALALQLWWWLLAAVVCGYGFAWFSHFVIEKNKPASFSYPLWSFAADWKLWALTLTGRMEAEAQRILATPAK